MTETAQSAAKVFERTDLLVSAQVNCNAQQIKIVAVRACRLRGGQKVHVIDPFRNGTIGLGARAPVPHDLFQHEWALTAGHQQQK